MTQLSLGKILLIRSFLFLISFCYRKHLISFFDGKGANHLVDFLWPWFLDHIRVSEWIVVLWSKRLIVGSRSKCAIVISVVGVSSVLLRLGTVARYVSGLSAVKAESFLQVLASFFITHRVESRGDNINIHGVWIISGLIVPLIVSSLVSWSGLISSPISLAESVGECLLSSHWFVVSFIESLDVVSMNSVEFNSDGVPSFLESHIFKSIRFLVGVHDSGCKSFVETFSKGSNNHVIVSG